MSRQERGIFQRFVDLLMPKPSLEEIVALRKISTGQISDMNRQKYINDRLTLVANMAAATRFGSSPNLSFDSLLLNSNVGWDVAREKERLEGLTEEKLDREISQWAQKEADRLHLT